MDTPSLTEPGIKFLFKSFTKKLQNTKDKYYNIIFNIISLLV